VAILADHLRRQAAAGRPTGPDDYVFQNPDDLGPIHTDHLRDHLYRTQAAVGVPKFRWHDFRHYVISARLAKGDDMLAISRWAGHSRLSTTADLYGHADAVDVEPWDGTDAPAPRLRVVRKSAQQ
jgi:integrase